MGESQGGAEHDTDRKDDDSAQTEYRIWKAGCRRRMSLYPRHKGTWEANGGQVRQKEYGVASRQ